MSAVPARALPVPHRRHGKAQHICHSSSSSSCPKILGIGSVGVDFLAQLDARELPRPDAKVRATRAEITTGGNVANGLTAAARLGNRQCALVSAVGDDANGAAVLESLAKDAVDASLTLVRGTRTPFTYIMIAASGENDGDMTRTCVHTPGDGGLMATDVTPERLDAAFSNVNKPAVAYFDGRLAEAALVYAREARRLGGVRILVEAERLRENLPELLREADLVVTSKSYPNDAYPEAKTLGDAVTRMFMDLPRAEIMVTTLGARGAIGVVRIKDDGEMGRGELLDDVVRRFEAQAGGNAQSDEDVRDGLPREPVESGVIDIRHSSSSSSSSFKANVIFAPAKTLAKGELVDPTGAGDAFIGALAHAYADEESFNLPSAMRLASYVAAMKCKAIGARAGLPRAADVPARLMVRTPRRAAMFSALVAAFGASVGGFFSPSRPAQAVESQAEDIKALTEIFNRAMRAQTYEEADAAWSEAIALAPNNSSAWSNRGTLRLQYSEWASAVDDLQRAVDLDGDTPDPLALNNLGNAKGALNRWDEAMADFLEASRVEDMRAIAQANYALAAFQTGRVDLAIATAKKLLRKDPEYLDMRALLSAMYWSEGIVDLAESEWTYLCKSGRGFGAKTSAEDVRGDDPASDLRYASTLLSQQFAQQFAELTGGVKEAGLDTPCRLYKTTDTVANRWPPRATAALDAFLRVRNYGEALDYDGRVKRFDFNF